MSKHSLWKKRIMAAIVAGTILTVIPLSGCSNSNDNDSGNDNSQTSSTASDHSDSSDKTDSSEQSDSSKSSETSDKSEEASNTVSESTQIPQETKFGDGIVVKSDNYSISYPVMQYLFNYMFQDFCNSYGTSYFDTTKDLKSQYYNEEEKISWYDYFLTSTENYLNQILVFAEGGKKENLSLSSQDEDSIKSAFEQMESYAAQMSMTADEYIKKEYGDTVSKDDIEKIQRMTLLAQQYNNFLYNSFVYSKEDYEAEYNQNKANYDVADYYVYSFTYDSDTTELEKAELKKQADELAKNNNKKDFQTAVTKYLKANPSRVSVTTSESSFTEAEFNAAVDAAVEATEILNGAYSDSNESYKWIFSTDRKAGDTTVVDENNAYNALLVTTPVHRNEALTRNIRHILISVTDNEKLDEFKEKANQILEEWENGDATEDSFAALATKYTEDPGSKSTGGLYTGVSEGEMVAEFNDWMFDPNRKVGDTGIVKTSYGFHIMYYPGGEMQKWQNTADGVLRQKSMSETYENMKTKYKVEFDNDTISQMTLTMPETSDAE